MNQMRQEKIDRLIQENKVATIKELQELCPEVSLMTIHRDLDTLESLGHIIKIRGGARAINQSEDPVFEIRERENLAAKAQIAQKAVEMIRPGSSVFMDAGTSNLFIAKALPDIHLSVVTTGPNIALELRHLTKPSINLCCGNLNRDNLAVSGHNTMEMLEKINIDLAFIGVSGCSIESGFTCGNEGDMMVKQLVIKKARTSAVLCDASKISLLMPFTFAKFEDIDYIISDGSLPEDFVRAAGLANTVVV